MRKKWRLFTRSQITAIIEDKESINQNNFSLDEVEKKPARRNTLYNPSQSR